MWETIPKDESEGKFYDRGLLAERAVCYRVIAYNTKLVKPEEAPKSHKDLLDPKWRGKIVKAHPAYSGTILTGMHARGGFDFMLVRQEHILERR